MRATTFEFRERFWIIAGVFFAGFACYWIDHVNAAHAIAGGHARLVIGLGAVIATLAALLRTWATAYLRTDVVKDARLHTDRLVADGPYRHVRNPLYLGTALLAVAFAPLASRTGAVVMIAGMLVFVLRLIGREEGELHASQGDAYRAYVRAVPRFLPALVPRVPASGAAPQWRQAVRGELMMWAFAAGIAAFAVSLDQRLLWAVVVAGFLGYLPGRVRSR